MSPLTNSAGSPDKTNVNVHEEKDDSTAESAVEAESQITSPTPYDWPLSRKVAIAVTVSLAQLVAVSSGSFMAAALSTIAADTHMSDVEAQISFCIYMLGLGFAPFVVGPASEVFGRKPVWIVGTVFYAMCNALCPVGRSKVVLIIFRFLSGVGASSGVVLTGPILADMFRKEQRGKAIAIGTLLPYLGPAIGPIIGGLLTQYVAWPWLFWMMSLFETGAIILGIFIIRETYGPVLRRQREAKQRKLQRGSGEKETVAGGSLVAEIGQRLTHPARLLLTRPIVQILALLNGINFGIYVLVLSIYATLFGSKYHQSPTASSLHYIAIALGACVSSQVGGRVMDWTYARMRKRAGYEDGRPEFRLPLLAAGSSIGTVGLLWLGWCAQAGVAWIMVDIGAFIFTTGSFATSQAALAYLLDEFVDDSASANAAVRMFSYLLAFGLPLPAPAMYRTLGYGWGTTLLALVWALLSVPLVLVLHLRGPAVRRLGRPAVTMPTRASLKGNALL